MMMNEKELAYKIAADLRIPKWQVDEAIERFGAVKVLEQLKTEEKEARVTK